MELVLILAESENETRIRKYACPAPRIARHCGVSAGIYTDICRDPGPSISGADLRLALRSLSESYILNDTE